MPKYVRASRTSVIVPKDPKIRKAMIQKYAMQKRGRVPKDIRDEVLELRAKYELQTANEEELNQVYEFLGHYFQEGSTPKAAALTLGLDYKNNTAYCQRMGRQFLKKARGEGLFQMYLEKEGYGLPKMLEILMKNMEDSKKPDWWDRGMTIAGYENMLDKKGGASTAVNVNIQSTHKQIADEYVIDGEIQKVNELEEKVA